MPAIKLWYRPSMLDKPEVAAIQHVFGNNAITQRTAVMTGDTVIGRMSVLPYYHEAELDVSAMGGRLVHDTFSHDYIANMDWFMDIGHLSFPTWFNVRDIPRLKLDTCAFVVKGKTNSKKMEWHDKMFVPQGKPLSEVIIALNNDGLIGPQGLVFREYVPLHTYQVLPHNGLPVVNEWRVFVYGADVLAATYYWAPFVDNEQHLGHARETFGADGMSFVNKCIASLNAVDGTPWLTDAFYVLDVAQCDDGHWVLVEINDGQMSGLNGMDPMALYPALRDILT